jgi:uncharacterized protein with FMN-binding domain
MRRITFAIMSTIAAVVLLFSYRTSTQGAGAPPSTVAAGSRSPATGSSPTTGSAPAAGSGGTVVQGSVARTRWGPVQVAVTISGGKITDVRALQQPTGNGRDQEINSYALPQLHDQAIAAQSAQLDGVSGATVTSDGYIESLQAALDAAHFG